MRRLPVFLAVLLVAGTTAGAQAAPDKPIPATLKRRFSVGGTGDMEFSPRYLDRTQVATDGVGRLYAVDSDQNQVIVFNAAGKRVRALGRKGRGPGELTAPQAIGATADGTVIVSDDAKGAFVRFGPDGKSLDEQSAFGLGTIQQILSADAQSIVLWVTRADSAIVVRVRGDSSERIVAIPQASQKAIQAYKTCGLGPQRQPVMLPPMLRAAAHPGAIVVSTASTFGFTLYEEAKPSRSITRDRAPEKLTMEMVRRMYGDSITMYVNRRRCAISTDKVTEEAGMATHMPPYSGFVFDNHGLLWAVRMTPPGAPSMSDLFSDGIYLGTINLGKTHPIAFMGDGGLVSLEKDADDAPMLVVYDVRMTVPR